MNRMILMFTRDFTIALNIFVNVTSLGFGTIISGLGKAPRIIIGTIINLTLIIMKYPVLFFVLFIYSCSGNNKQQSKTSSPAAPYTSNDTIPIARKQVSKSPVASYIIPINNPLLHQYFGAKVYETLLTFQFLLTMRYEGMIETDTLKIPNFGTWPIVQIKKGPEKLSCIIGFLDKEKNFKEYKMLSARDNKLKLTVLKRYGVSVYSSSK